MGICVSRIENLKGTNLVIFIRKKCKQYKNTSKQIEFNQTMNLISNLNYEDINEKCCEEFQKSNFMLLFGENYKDFIEKLFLNIKSNTSKEKKDYEKESMQNIKNMNIILNLFKRNNQYSIDEIACEEFEKLFDKNIILFSSVNINELDDFFINSMNFLTANSSEKINEIIESITNSFLIDDFLPFYVDILEKDTINYDVQEIIVDLLVDKSINDNKLELLLEEIFEKLSMEHIHLFIEKLVNKITINKDDFYKEENSFSILLFYQINISEYDIVTNYIDLFESLYNIIDEFYNNIMKKQIQFNELEKLYHLILQKLYHERMYILCKGEINLMNTFEKTIYEDYEKYLQLKNKYSSKINYVLIFLNFYFKDILEQKIQEYKEKLNHIEEFNLIDLDYSNDEELIEDFKIAQKYSELLNSLSFLGILEYHKSLKKKKKEVILNYEILEIVYKDFQTLNNFLIGDFYSINHLIPSILKKINSKDKLIYEMILLKRYFKIENDTSEIEAQIMFYINKKKYQKILYYLIQLIDDFKINKMNLYDTNSIYTKLQEESNSFCEIIELYNNLNDIYLKLFNSKISSQNLINLYKFCTNEENINNKNDNIDNESNLVNFLINLTIEEIEKLNEFLEDDEINFQDLDDLELCNTFIKTLNYNINNNYSDENLIEDFINYSENKEKLAMAIENIGNKFYKIKEKFDSNIDIKQSKSYDIKLLN